MNTNNNTYNQHILTHKDIKGMKIELSYNKVRLGVAALLCLCATPWVEAKVKLPALISDGMVLQREQPVKLWGTADAGETVEVKFLKKSVKNEGKVSLPAAMKGSKLKASYTAVADESGQWNIVLPPLKAGGPYLLQVNDIELKDILPAASERH